MKMFSLVLRFVVVCSFLFAALLSASPAEAQVFKKMKDAAKRGAERAAERETSRRADRAVTKVFEAGDDAVACVAGDDACARRAREAGKQVVLVGEDGRPLPEARQPAATTSTAIAEAQRPGEGAWANYDFVPGARVLYFADYENERAGGVPRGIDFQSGVVEVVRKGDNQMLRFSDAASFALPLPETLPERFTIEFDLYSGDDWNSFVLGTGPLDGGAGSKYHCFHGDLVGHSAAEFKVGSTFGTGVAGGGGGTSAAPQSAHEKAMVPVRIAVDGSYAKMYVGEKRVANVPNAGVQRTGRVLVTACGELAAEQAAGYGPILLDNVRVAAGGREMLYERLQADGRLALGGLLFDTGSARLRPESTPTLQDLREALGRNPELRVRIEGHTDDTGPAAANRRLSQERAEAVAAWLTGKGIDAARLEAAGLGPAQPAADNATPEGRQTNRRVELVKL